MLVKKIPIKCGAALLVLAIFLSGCTPAGPRAFFAGKQYMDQGDYANAAARFKIAATLLATNAVVWNYYGMALQADHQPQAAAAAYQRALELDRDLVEAHFNLGGLWLEQNQPDEARTEFTAYTLRRSNDPEGWLKLGSAELRLEETIGAEKSFSKVLYLKPGDAAADNGMGLAQIQRGKPHDAARFFTAAIKSDPGFAPAILNLATINHQYLHDDKTALANYQAYLALTPRPADWDEVNSLANQLEQPGLATAPPVATFSPPPPEKKRPSFTGVVHNTSRPSEPRPEVPQKQPVETSSTEVVANERPSNIAPAMPVQVVQVAPPPQIIASPRAAANLPPPAPASEPPVELPIPAQPDQKSGFWHRLFTPSENQKQQESTYLENGVTPLPSAAGAADTSLSSPKPAPVPLTRFPRYQFISPRKPGPGDHANGTPAAGALTRAQLYEQDEKWSDALQYYAQAAQADPSWFVAQYNTAVLAQRLRIYSQSLTAYEYALAIQPDSMDAR
ncbi:MAG TPA: tetratricopeptide repeat protein, partial [Candidatus Acidoferrum sp.]|nr:tetratricopeptide repeat protein [Candidatus Acidoferrum sp.]